MPSVAASGVRGLFASRRVLAVAAVIGAMVLAAVLAVLGLDNHRFWDDEANTAIYARNLLNLGKLTAFDGTNLVGYSYGGSLGEDLGRELRVPVLPAYVAAAGMYLSGQTTFGGRMMFVVAGVLSVGLLAVWLRRHLGRRFAWYLPPLILALSPAYLLYIRNCRYYALGVTFTLLIWIFWAPGSLRGGSLRGRLFDFGLLVRCAGGAAALVLLVWTHYLNAASVLVTLPLFLLDPRYRQGKQYVILGVLYATAAVCGAWILIYANPFAADYLVAGESAAAVVGQGDRWTRFYTHLGWLLRDLGTHEFFPWCLAALMVIAWVPATRLKVSLYRVRPLARRGLILVAVVLSYVVLAALLTPADMAKGPTAEMRYVVPVIALGAAVGGLALVIVWRLARPLAPLVFLLLTMSNLLHLGFVMARLDHTNRCWPPTLYRYVREQFHDYKTGNEAMIALLDRLPEGTTVRMWPPYMVYPPMFYVPKLHYCDQLNEKKKISEELVPLLSDYLYVERARPQVMLVPSPYLGAALEDLESRYGPEAYRVKKTLKYYWSYTSKPEIPGHFFARPDEGWINYPEMVVLAQKDLPAATAAPLAGSRRDAEVLYRLGRALKTVGKDKAALLHLREAVRIAPNRPLARFDLGVLLARQPEREKIEEAVEHFKAAVRLDPEYANAYVNMGIALQALGKKQEAERQFRTALEIKPGLPHAHYNLANFLAEQERVVEAETHYLAALRHDRKYTRAHVNLGGLYFKLGKVDDAIAHYRAALRIAPNFVQAHLNLGVALAADGNKQGAISEFEKVLELLPVGSPLVPKVRKMLGGISGQDPDYYTISQVELHYAGQLRRLTELARDPVLRAKLEGGELLQSDKRLFAPEEILEAKLEASPGSYLIVGEKRFDFKMRRSLVFKSLGPGRPTLTKHACEMHDGQKVNALEYAAEIVDKDDRKIEIVLLLDADKLPAAGPP